MNTRRIDYLLVMLLAASCPWVGCASSNGAAGDSGGLGGGGSGAVVGGGDAALVSGEGGLGIGGSGLGGTGVRVSGMGGSGMGGTRVRASRVGGSGLGGSGAGGSGGQASTPAGVRYVATNGSDSGDGSAAKPWATFVHAFSQMRSGDTLLIKDGEYRQDMRSREGIEGFPSGKPNAYTMVKAEHDWQVKVYGTLTVASMSYVQIQGIHFMKETNDLTGHHLKIVRCSFRGDVCQENHAVFNIGAGSSDVLVEECFAYGCGRYKFLIYGDDGGETHNILLRRCVSRHDYHDPNAFGWQSAPFVSYTSQNVIFQNCIAIDSGDKDVSKYGTLYGGIWVENKPTLGEKNDLLVQDSIFMNIVKGTAIQDPYASSDRVIENSVFVNSEAGYYGGVRLNNPTLRLDHITAVDIWGTVDPEWPVHGVGATVDETFDGFSFASAVINNSILTRCHSYGIVNLLTSDYNDYFDNGANYGSTGNIRAPAKGAHDLTVDPGLKYPFRLEAGSPLKNAGSDGKDLGAYIMYRRGVSGTLYGEPGWDQVTDEPLWPFPNEAVIKATMAAWDGAGFTTKDANALNVPTRGFCAPGNGLYGGPITLSSYLWEALGNPCPADICPR